MDPKLLALLRCPVTKQPVRLVDNAQLARLNRAIKQGKIVYNDGTPLSETLSAALITINEHTIYPVVADIPVMLEEQGIVAEQLQEIS